MNNRFDKHIIFSDIIEHAPFVVMRLSKILDNWGVWFVTKNISMYGYDRDEFMEGKLRLFDIVHPDDRILLLKQISDYEQQKIDEFRLYYRILTKNGNSVPICEYSYVGWNDDHEVRFYDSILISNVNSESDYYNPNAHYRQQIILNDILLTLHDSDLDHALQIILDSTGKYLDCSRVLLCRDSEDHETCKVIYEWSNHGITSILDLDYTLNYKKDIPEIYYALQEHGILLINHGEIPLHCQEEFKKEHLTSSAIYAVYLYGAHYGFICFDDCVRERTWDSDTSKFLKIISNLISTVLVRQESAKQLEITQRTCETVLDNIDSYIFAVHPNTNKIIFANEAFRSSFDPNCIGEDINHYLQLNLSEQTETKLIDNGFDKPYKNTTYQEVYSETVFRWLYVTHELISWVNGQTIRLINCYDITSKKVYEDTITKLAYLDHLTSLPNRYRCDVDLEEALEESKNAKQPGYLLFIDIDDFKIINDCYGHDYGDGILVTFAKFLQDLFPYDNKIFRFGGDEFVILINYRDADKIEYYLTNLIERGSRSWKSLDKEFYCTLSIGVVEFSDKDDNVKAIIKNADIALYEAKRLGKNNYQFYEERFGSHSLERSQMELLLRNAMDNNFQGFQIYYQPILDVKTGAICGAEALIRMLDENGKIYLPADFITLAEYLGFMVPIGEYVLRQASLECRRINETICEDFTMTINLSSKQYNEKNILLNIESIFADTKVDLSKIIIGIEEDTAFMDMEKMSFLTNQFKDKGIKVVLDNFGGGSSSFIRLKDLNVDMIKTPSSFLTDLEDEDSKHYINFIIELSSARNKRICVNGVETKAQYNFCKESGADYVQGFYLHKPKTIVNLHQLFLRPDKGMK